jgi:hypothetical protein
MIRKLITDGHTILNRQRKQRASHMAYHWLNFLIGTYETLVRKLHPSAVNSRADEWTFWQVVPLTPTMRESTSRCPFRPSLADSLDPISDSSSETMDFVLVNWSYHIFLPISWKCSRCSHPSSNLKRNVHCGLGDPVVTRMGVWCEKSLLRFGSRTKTIENLHSQYVFISTHSSFSYVCSGRLFSK